MKMITTDNPSTNYEIWLNRLFVKDGQAMVRVYTKDGQEKHVRLIDHIRGLLKKYTHIDENDAILTDDDTFDAYMSPEINDNLEPEHNVESLIIWMYWNMGAQAVLHNHLKKYESIGDADEIDQELAAAYS